MDGIAVETVAEPSVEDPVLVEGLPGVGHIGKLAADHLLAEFDSSLVRVVYADEFPPQVTVEDGVAELVRAEFHAVETDGQDLLVLTGDHQAQTTRGHYGLTDTFLDIATDIGVEQAFALGGVPTGELVEEHAVIGAVNDATLTAELADAGVEFREAEPEGGIVGVTGLLLGLGARRDIDAACLMGETSGYIVDPKSARAVLETLETLLGFDIEFGSLEDRAAELEEVIGRIQELQEQATAVPDDELRYIG